MLSKSIGKNIKQFRTAKGISQEDLASDLFVTRQTISNYETGRSFPDVDMLQKIAIALDVDLLWLLYGRPASHNKKANAKTALFFVGFFVAFSCVTLLLYLYTESLKQSKFLFRLSALVSTAQDVVKCPKNWTPQGVYWHQKEGARNVQEESSEFQPVYETVSH